MMVAWGKLAQPKSNPFVWERPTNAGKPALTDMTTMGPNRGSHLRKHEHGENTAIVIYYKNAQQNAKFTTFYHMCTPYRAAYHHRDQFAACFYNIHSPVHADSPSKGHTQPPY